MRKDNMGYSLLEMIIVIGIAAILAGSAVSFTGYIRFANSKSCAEKLYAGIDKLQVTSMAKKEKKLMIVWRENGAYYYDVFSYDPTDAVHGVSGNAAKVACKDAFVGTAAGTKLGNSALNMKYKKDDGTYHTLADNDYFFISYAMDGSYSRPRSDGFCMNDTDEIVIESASGDGMTYTIKLIPETGKHFIQ